MTNIISEIRKQLLDDAFKAIKKAHFKGWLILPTGLGKSSVLVNIIKTLKPKTCWYLCDSTLNRDVTFKNELIKFGAEKYIDKIEFLCYQTAYKLKGGNPDLILADEADFAMTEKYSQVFKNNTSAHIVLVSATLKDDRRALAKKIAPIAYEKGLHQIEGLGALNKSKYYTVKYKLLPEENKRYKAYNNQFSRLLNTRPVNHFKVQQLQLQRKHFLSNLDSGLATCKTLLKDLYKDSHRKILIFCGLSKQADRVCKYSFHTNNENDNDNFNLFDKGDIRVLSVVGKIDRGVNIDGVNTVIFESPGASNTKWQQKSGRARRLAVDETVDIYFLIPYYTDYHGHLKPTIVEKWIYESVGKLDIKPIEYNLKYD